MTAADAPLNPLQQQQIRRSPDQQNSSSPPYRCHAGGPPAGAASSAASPAQRGPRGAQVLLQPGQAGHSQPPGRGLGPQPCPEPYALCLPPRQQWCWQLTSAMALALAVAMAMAMASHRSLGELLALTELKPDGVEVAASRVHGNEAGNTAVAAPHAGRARGSVRIRVWCFAQCLCTGSAQWVSPDHQLCGPC